MLLILTNSLDATSDEIIRRIGVDGVFRLNVDLWQDYEVSVGPDGFWLRDPSGRMCASQRIAGLYVRKPTFDDPIDVPAGGSLESWSRSNISYVVQEIYNWAKRRGLVRLVEKGAAQRFGKLSQMWVAERYFKVPPWRFAKSSQIDLKSPIIAKGLVPEMVENNQFFYASKVSPETLNPAFPWFVQEEVAADFDVTVLFIRDKCFAYQLDRGSFDGPDWRRSINRQNLNWEPCQLDQKTTKAISDFMQEAELIFGRLDFLRKGEDLFFLEVNANGQWAWLDLDGKQGIFDAVILELTKPDRNELVED